MRKLKVKGVLLSHRRCKAMASIDDDNGLSETIVRSLLCLTHQRGRVTQQRHHADASFCAVVRDSP